MRVRHRLVVNLLVFFFLKGFLLASADDKQPVPSLSSVNNKLQGRDLSPALKKNEKPKQGRGIYPYPGGNTHDKRGSTNRWLAFEQKAKKLSEVAVASILVEKNTTHRKENNKQDNEHSRNASSTATSPQTTQTADYGILGTSDDEDSAKWAQDEMKKAAENKANSHDKDIKQNISTVASTLRVIPSKNQSHYINSPVKIILTNSGGNMPNALTQTKSLNKSNKNEINENLIKNLKPDQGDAELIFSNSTNLEKTGKDIVGGYGTKSPLTATPERMLQNKTPSSSTPQSSTAQNITTSTHNDTNTNKTVQQTVSGAIQTKAPENTMNHLIGAQRGKAYTQNVSVSDTVLHLSELGSRKNNTSGNTTLLEEQNSLSGAESADSSQKSNQSQNNEKPATYPKAPSLEVNILSLRKGQSFDFQIPSTIPLKSSDQSNHIHIEPNDTLKSSEYLPKDVKSNPSNSDFLNETLDKVLLEEIVKTGKSNKLLQKFNSDLLASRAEPLSNNVNLEVTDQPFREESSADRTFSENILEPYSNEAGLTRRLNTLQGRQEKTEVQQDESLAKALNSSSVSSIIFGANRALFDTDREVFSKKSSQARLNGAIRDKDHRHKRSDVLHRLTKLQRINRLASNTEYPKRKHASRGYKKQRVVSARQVINLGNHFLWFGGQSSADANGFPRHNTATENNAYSANGYISNFLNTAKENKTPSATKGFKALQSALTSMVSNQVGLTDSYTLDPMYTEPIEKQWQASDGENATATGVIQNGTEKAVYNSMVNNVKSNETKTQISSNSITSLQSNYELIDHGTPYKENKTDREQTKSEFVQNMIGNGTSAINNSSIPITSDEKSANGENATILQISADSTGHLYEKNSSALSGGIQLLEQSMSAVQSEIKDSHRSPNVTVDSEKEIKQQPSAIIKKISTNSQEPETYHVLVNDAGKKITNANGHVTVIISGPTATQASMPNENTLLIPQTSPSQFLPENDFLSTNDHRNVNISHSATQAVNKTSVNENKGNGALGNKQIAPLSLLQEDIEPALKISEEIERHQKKAPADSSLSTSRKEEHKLPKQNTDAHVLMNEKDDFTSDSREESTHNGHHFVKVGQDLTSDIGDLQMEEVSRPDLQEAQRKVQEKLAEDATGGFLLGGDQLVAEQAQDVPTLNIVLNPMQRIDGSLSVGGKVIPIGSAKEGYSKQFSFANEQGKQKLDCHADTINEKAGTTMLTCQKKHGLANILSAFQGDGYSENLKAANGPSLQLDQVMNVLNDQVKTTINKEMKTESKDIEDVLKDMTMPSSTLMDTEEAYSQEEPPEHSSLMDTDDTFTSQPGFVRQNAWKNDHHYHRKIQPFGFFHGFGLSHYPRFHRHFGIPNRRHFWGYSRHSHPLVVMAQKDSDEGFWDYQHNIFIPRGHDDEYDDDDDEGSEETKAKHWVPWSRHGHRKGTWLMAHPPVHPRHRPFLPFGVPSREQNLAHFRLPTLFSRSGPWRPLHSRMTVPQSQKEEKGAKRTAVVHKAIRGDRDLCRPVIGGPSPPLKGEWEYLGKVLSSCPCKLMDTEW
ncbi:uncharacterized protein LOC111328381 [Stylophora pistillata]|uniref:Uncharacterized protein n=1 Tax=Stylophora pistillata TaxID=50429 RepID=A0A2B4SBY4_STYPI|nr:uncharacterized protein LOC111328381 [Stylophora pistillata]PFX26876.1 hypothetical protein AWC38_SpisGene8438 [Stylophora pistillata]